MKPLSSLLSSSSCTRALLAGGVVSLSLVAVGISSPADARDYKRSSHGGQPLITEKALESSGVAGHKQNGFGRLFPVSSDPGAGSGAFPPQASSTEKLRALGKQMVEPRAWQTRRDRRSNTPSGYIFLGQFIDHDITLDTKSHLDQKADADKISNFRTVDLDLDNIYGDGPEANPFLYNLPYLRLGKRIRGITGPARYDLLRTQKKSGSGARGGGAVAIIGDPRNDENFVISQMQAAFITYHNAMADRIVEREYGKSRRKYCRSVRRCRSTQKLAAALPGDLKKEVFEQARDHVIHYYHRIIAEDFLPRVIGLERADDIRKNGRVAYFPDGFKRANGGYEQPFIPFEFSVAAYRFGHAMVHQDFRLRARRSSITPLFKANKNGGRPVSGFSAITSRLVLDWRYFFPISTGYLKGFNNANKLAPMLPIHLHDLASVGVTGPDEPSLAARNLMRGRAFRLPSGQAIARAILPRLKARGALSPWQSANADWRQLLMSKDAQSRFSLGRDETPLWYYILQEAASFERVDSNIRVASKERRQKASRSGASYLLPKKFRKLPSYAKFVAAESGKASGANAAPAAATAQAETGLQLTAPSQEDVINNILGGGSGTVQRPPAVAKTRPVAPAQPAPTTSAKPASAGKIKLDLTNVGGDSLGPVGGTLVGEVLFGLLEHYRLTTGKGLAYKPQIKAVATSNNQLLRRKVRTRFQKRNLTATKDNGLRYQMRNLIYDAGLALPVKVSGKRR